MSQSKKYHKNTHPTVKPVALMVYLIRLVTPPGGTVLDPFCGSGSTGMGARKEGFSFIGIDKELENCDIARARIASCKPEERVIPQELPFSNGDDSEKA
jgi:site-specific DNA-methyltransferase (adenine-specific)